MLTKESKIILDDLILNSKAANPKDYNLARINEIYPKMSRDEFLSILNFLVESEYVTYKVYLGENIQIVVTHKGLNYKEFEHQSESSSVFNINNAYGSVIGTQQNVTLNYKTSLSQLKNNVNSCNSDDKESLQTIISLLEMIIDNQVPPNKGIFSKFSVIMERNSWFTSAVSSTIMSWLMTQIP